MWCPNCRAEYVEGWNTCVDCEVDLVDILPPEVPHDRESTVSEEGDDPVVLMIVRGRLRAELIRSLLEGSGVKVESEAQTLTGFSYNPLQDQFPARIWVRSRDLARARQVIPAAEDGSLELVTETETRSTDATDERSALPPADRGAEYR